MLKHLLIGIIAVAFAFLWAGVATNVFALPMLSGRGGDGGREVRYRFFLGCGLSVTMCGTAVYSAICGRFIISVFAFIAVCIGAALVLCCLKKPNNNAASIDRSTTENDDMQTDDYRPKKSENEEKTATDSGKEHLKSRIYRLVTQYPRRRAIACGIMFAVFLAVFSLFITALDSEREIVEKTVAFQTAQNAEGAIFLTDSDGAETYAIFGYALQNDLFGTLNSAVDGERTFTVRYTVMDRDEWSGYYRLLSIRDGDGVSYLEETEVAQSRSGAVTEKAMIFGTLALLCGCACGAYTALAVKERHCETKTKTERIKQK